MREAALFASRQNEGRVPSLVTALLDIVSQLISQRQRRRNLARVAELDDRLLDDIGLERSDVRWALDQPRGAPVGAELRRRAWRRARLGRG